MKTKNSSNKILPQVTEAQFNPRWGYHFFIRFFCFHLVKPLMPILALLSILVFVKTPIEQALEY